MKIRFLTILYTITKYVFVLIIKTCKISSPDYSALKKESLNSGASVYCWHEKLILPPLLKCFLQSIHNKLIPVVSGSRDGNLFNNYFLKSLKEVESCIRVHRAAKHHALRSMVTALKNKKVLFVTPDGPNGPLHEVKTGAILSNKLTKTPIYLLSWRSSSVWKVPSWDKLQIPKPFSKIQVFIDGPIYIDKDADIKVMAKVLSASLSSLENLKTQ
jgi:Kdo2-lipid IVA 3' secondary acyltransferase